MKLYTLEERGSKIFNLNRTKSFFCWLTWHYSSKSICVHNNFLAIKVLCGRGDGGEGRGTLSIVVWCLNERFEPACNERQREREGVRGIVRERYRENISKDKNVLALKLKIIKILRPLNQLHGSLNLFTLITSIVIKWIFTEHI